MRIRWTAVAVLGGMVLLAGASLAEAQAVSLKIPFSFVISDRTFPAGQYSLASSREKVMVQDAEGKTIAMMFSNAVSGRQVGATGEVVFHCYGNHCFLSELWTPTSDVGRQLLRSKYEIETAKLAPETYFALMGTPAGRK
jgi:hypothetical protein